MTIEPTSRPPQSNLSNVPVVGKALGWVRGATEPLRPLPGDSAITVVGKRVAQGAIVTGVAAVTIVAIV